MSAMASSTDPLELLLGLVPEAAPHPASFAPHPSQARNPSLYSVERSPLLCPEIVTLIFSHLLNDKPTLIDATEVCRLWWQEGHHHVWRFAHISKLMFLRNAERRKYYASLIEELDLIEGDTVLADPRLAQLQLCFPRLRSVKIGQSNLARVRYDNLKSLIGPALRSWDSADDNGVRGPTADADDVVHLNALLEGCESLTDLSFVSPLNFSADGLILDLLDRTTALKSLLLMGHIAEELVEDHPPADILQKWLNKPHLISLDVSHEVCFSQFDIDGFLGRMGESWTNATLRRYAITSFENSLAAARLFARMPNLEELIFTVEGPWDDNIHQLFATMSKLTKLQHLRIDFHTFTCHFDGACLLQLTGLKNLEALSLQLPYHATASITGTQLARFLSSLPNLKDLSLLAVNLHAFEVPCLPGEREIIQDAMAKFEKKSLPDLVLTDQEVL